jgi:transcriptional regulator with XRE-family HTH domain
VFCSLGEPADSESASAGSGPIYLMDAFAKTLSDQIADRIATLRRSRGMSTAEFARFLGVSPRRLLDVERGRRPITVELLFDLCRKCRKPKEFFLAGTLVDRPFYQVRRARRIGGGGGPARNVFSEGLRCCGPVRLRALVNDDRNLAMVPFIVRLTAQGTSSDALVEHGGQEFLYVLRGAIRLLTVQDGRPLTDVLSPGDCCFIDASVPHRYVDVRLTAYDRQTAEAILVVSRR